jgi:hypothetical protein
MVEKIRSPKLVIVKTMTVNKKMGIVHNYFDKMKYMEMGDAIRPGSLTKAFLNIKGLKSIHLQFRGVY